ncbi:DinB family protein [Saprospiraceae bacterium]|nr:DinB family protein [Saprospiraceae bacterium]
MSSLSHKLQSIILDSIDKFAAIPKKRWNAKKDENSWSKKEILGHLIDSCYNNHGRFLRAESLDNLIFEGYDQNKWVEMNNYAERDHDDIIDTFIISNLHLANLIGNIPDSVMTKMTTKHNFHLTSMVTVEEGSERSLEYMVSDYIFHLNHHLAQILG